MAFKQASYSHIFKFNPKDTLLLWSNYSFSVFHSRIQLLVIALNNGIFSRKMDIYLGGHVVVYALIVAVTHSYPITLSENIRYITTDQGE